MKFAAEFAAQPDNLYLEVHQFLPATSSKVNQTCSSISEALNRKVVKSESPAERTLVNLEVTLQSSRLDVPVSSGAGSLSSVGKCNWFIISTLSAYTVSDQVI